MHSTQKVLGRGSVSTSHGQQRILKFSTPDLLTYIQKSVKTGVYRSNEEIEEMNKELSENPVDLKRMRWNVNRGSRIEDYPKEYEILSLNPPEPFQPYTPLKDMRKARNLFVHKYQPTDRLARKYLSSRKDHQQGKDSATSEDYYRRLLGSQKAPKMESAMGSKSALLNKAYAVAVKQYQLMRTKDISEKDALDEVEELLKGQEFTERTTSRTRAETLAKRASKQTSDTPENRAEKAYPKPEGDVEGDYDESLVSLYSEDQRAFEGMISWTHRLQAVPYQQWTVGASVALDHWIAKRVLGLSEETWLALLEGDSPKLIGRGRDIVMARHALFPETMIDGEELFQDGDTNENAEDTSVEDLDSLLAKLEGWNTDEKDSRKFNCSGESESSQDDKVLQLTAQLQDWRAKQQESQYEQWPEDQKKLFKLWLQDYVETLTPESSISKVDMTATRIALLSSPPQTKEDSNKFWEGIQDETAAELFLQQLLKDKSIDREHPFFHLEYPVQLERLTNLGSIRALADEYATENDRSKFVARYGDYLLEGLDFEHLVLDPMGSIKGTDLGERLMQKYNISTGDRFRLEKIPFGSDEFGTDAFQRARDMFRAWNLLKAGRAHYEEKLFKQGMLGLTYEERSQN